MPMWAANSPTTWPAGPANSPCRNWTPRTGHPSPSRRRYHDRFGSLSKRIAEAWGHHNAKGRRNSAAFEASKQDWSAGTVHHHGFTLDPNQTLVFQRFQNAAHHFPGTTNDTADLLAGDLDLHAIRMRHGVWLLAQIEQGARHPAGHVQERQVTNLTGGLAQAGRHLLANEIQHPGVLLGDFTELGVTDLRHFTLGLGFDPGAAGIHVVKQAHFAEKVSGVQVGHDHLAAIIVFNDDGDGTFDDVKQGVAFVTGINNGAFGGVTPTVALGKEIIQVFGFLLNRLDDGSHSAGHASSESGDS